MLVDESQEVDAEVISGSKRRRLEHDAQSATRLADGPRDPVELVYSSKRDMCSTHAQIDKIPSDEHTAKRRKVDDDSPLIAMSDHETHSLPSNLCSVSVPNETPRVFPRNPDEDGKASGHSVAIALTKKSKKTKARNKGKKPTQYPQLEMDAETDPLQQDGGFLDARRIPIPDHDCLDIPVGDPLAIVGSEGSQQAPDNQLVNEDVEMVTIQDGQLDYALQPLMNALATEGSRDKSSCCKNTISVEDSDHPTFNPGECT
jgi:hypothetical protein